MSDLKKTFQDMDKTEVGEYRHGRGHFPTEDDGGRANVEVLQALCPNPGATALESVVWAADQIEALRRENEELRTDRDNWKGWKQAASRAAERLEQENAELRAKQMTGPAITPEMRERIEAHLKCYRSGNHLSIDFCTCATEELLRDLLREQDETH